MGEPGGLIEPGARADLSVFRRNPLRDAPDDFATTQVVLTVVDGDVVVLNDTDEPRPAPPVSIPARNEGRCNVMLALRRRTNRVNI
ncbi:cytosine/adenosine deaminase-related metal-dependent hydrolase [Arthrobacter sp. V4I6]|nr:cytosine/adenosine deaminase-related metal-dependent hydrolase [Arthrobacter sp. V1I7]MDQ0853556.1 cytosine/adenosine deaminase-related metal-dependent hydrolase [Arthrobacter sp. V4I6]